MSREIRLLSVEEVVEIHADGISEHGGSRGVRDIGLIESAVTSAQNLILYSKPDLAEVSAAYLFALCKNHGFVDGNKRVALRAADVFLNINGLDLHIESSEAHDLTVSVATGELGREELAEIIRRHTIPLEP